MWQVGHWTKQTLDLFQLYIACHGSSKENEESLVPFDPYNVKSDKKKTEGMIVVVTNKKGDVPPLLYDGKWDDEFLFQFKQDGFAPLEKSMRASEKRKPERYQALGEKRVVGTMAIAKRMWSRYEFFLTCESREHLRIRAR